MSHDEILLKRLDPPVIFSVLLDTELCEFFSLCDIKYNSPIMSLEYLSEKAMLLRAHMKKREGQCPRPKSLPLSLNIDF